MQNVSAFEAKQNFGRLIDTAQREPVTIEKHNRAVAVVISAKDYEEMEALKLEAVRGKIKKGIDQIKKGEVIDGEQFFQELLDEKTH